MRLSTSLLVLSLASGLVAQNQYYVDGATGKDVASNGTSPASPWKTITYALTKIPSPADPNFHVLNIAGGQVYAARTNGESFPILAVPNVQLTGVGNALPVLDSGGKVTLGFDRSKVFSSYTTTRRLILQNSASAVVIGGDQGVDHSPAFVDCEIRQVSFYGVWIRPVASRTGVILQRCAFRDCDYGIRLDARSVGANCSTEVWDCTFENMRTYGIHMDASNGNATFVRCDVDRSTFVGGKRGISVDSKPGTRLWFGVDECFFRDASEAAIRLNADRLASCEGSIVGSLFRVPARAQAVDVRGVFAPGTTTINCWANVAFGASKSGTGYRFAIDDTAGSGLLKVVSYHNHAIGFGTGFSFREPVSSNFRVQLESGGDRALLNNVGMSLSDGGAPSTYDITSAMFCGNDFAGLVTSHDLGSDPVIRGSNWTVARNGGHGILRNGVLGVITGLTNSVFADNRIADVSDGGIPITWTCFKDTAYPGTGNLQADPRLVGTFYKIAADSPCIDRGDPAASPWQFDYELDPRRVPGRKNVPARVDMGADEYVPAGSVRNLGVAVVGARAMNPRLSIAATGVVPGDRLPIRLAGAATASGPAEAALLYLGFSENLGSVLFDLTPFGAPGSLLWQELTLLAAVSAVASDGGASFTLPLPADPKLAGLVFVAQWVVVKNGVNPANIVTTNAMRITLGR